MEPPSYSSKPAKRIRIQNNQEVAAPRWPTYKIILNDEVKAETLALVILQKTQLNLNVRITRTASGKQLLRPKDATALAKLQEMTTQGHKPFQLQQLQDSRQVVLCGVPLQLSEQDIMNIIPEVAVAERLTAYDQKMKEVYQTSSVRVTWTSRILPSHVKTTFLGTLEIRPWTPDPTRCYRCQQYGYVTRECTAKQQKCGICSANHETKVVYRRGKMGKQWNLDVLTAKENTSQPQ